MRFKKARVNGMPQGYTPPFTMTEEITNLVIEIAELTGQISLTEQLSKNPKLRRRIVFVPFIYHWQLNKILYHWNRSAILSKGKGCLVRLRISKK